jgi:hypothetical protein
MKQVVIAKRSAGQIMEIVQELRASGLVQGKDFDFAYYQSRWDEMIGEVPSETVFTFYQDKYSTLFALKYSSI